MCVNAYMYHAIHDVYILEETLVFKDTRNVHFTIFFPSPKLKTSNNSKILEKPRVTGNAEIINPSVLLNDDENIFEQQLTVFL
jgi:hypothetical protein